MMVAHYIQLVVFNTEASYGYIQHCANIAYLPGAHIHKGGIAKWDNTRNNSLWFQVGDKVTQLTVACMHGVDDSVLVDLW